MVLAGAGRQIPDPGQPENRLSPRRRQHHRLSGSQTGSMADSSRRTTADGASPVKGERLDGFYRPIDRREESRSSGFPASVVAIQIPAKTATSPRTRLSVIGSPTSWVA